MQILKYTTIALFAGALLSVNSSGQQTDGQAEMLPLECVEVYQALPFTKDTDQPLLLDLYVPEKTANTPPLLVWIHGGGNNGSESRLDSILELTDEGYAVASFDSRPNGLSAGPQHLKNCKGAIRWLQAQADEFGYDTTRVGVVGGSGGARLAMMLGMTADVDELEGTVAGNLERSSRVHAVVSIYAAGDAIEFPGARNRYRNQNLSSDELPSANRAPRFLTPDDAPLLIIQGNQDPSVRVSPGQLLYQRYREAGCEMTLCTLEVAGHGGLHFGESARNAIVKAFFDKHIKQIQPDVFADAPQASTETQEQAASNTRPQTDRGSRRRDEFGKRFAAHGAQVGQVAPDATVYTLAGEPFILSSLWNDRPTLLVTGSITCPIASRNCPSLTPLQDDYGDEVNVVILYQREAHPKLEDQAANRPTNRFLGGNAGLYPQPKTLDERMTLAKVFDKHMSSTVQIVVADISNDVSEALGGGPNMGLLINRDGQIVVKQGWYNGEVMRSEVAALLAGEPQ